MKSIDIFWENPFLAKYTRTIPREMFLFKQADPGKSMFIIVRGIVQLFAVRGGKQYPVTFVEAGSFLGEQALVGDEVFFRVFGAQALTDLTVIELDKKACQTLRETQPDLLIDILTRTFKVASDRLNRLNRLMSLLRSSNNTERFLYLLLHLSAHQGRVVPEGKEVILSFDMVRYYIDMSEFEMEELLKELCERKSLIKRDEHLYIIRNEKALQDQIPKLREELSPLAVL